MSVDPILRPLILLLVMLPESSVELLSLKTNRLSVCIVSSVTTSIVFGASTTSYGSTIACLRDRSASVMPPSMTIGPLILLVLCDT